FLHILPPFYLLPSHPSPRHFPSVPTRRSSDLDGRGDLQRAAVGRGELLVRGLPLVLVAVVRADGMDDAGHVEAVRPGDLRVADLAPAEGAALLEQAGSGGGVDRAVDSPAAEQARVRGVDDRLDISGGELRDVAEVDEDLHGVSLRGRMGFCAGAVGGRARARCGARYGFAQIDGIATDTEPSGIRH